LAGAYLVIARDVADWQETRDTAFGVVRTSKYRSLAPDLPVVVCFFDGEFDHFPGKGNRPTYDRLVVFVNADDQLVLDSAGPRANLKVERPGIR